MTITNEAVEVAARALMLNDPVYRKAEWDYAAKSLRSMFLSDARAALEAAEPFITAELRAEIDRRQTDRHSQSLAMISLRARLARIEAAAMLILQSPSFADVEPNDRDPEDIAAERALRAALKED